MAEYQQINAGLADRFKQSFGFVAANAIPRIADVGVGGKFVYANLPVITPKEQVSISPARSNTAGTIQVELLPVPEAVKMSKMGTPIFEDFSFVGNIDDQTQLKYEFEISPMVDLTRTKHIVTTDINDMEGEVVEVISNKPWSIRFRGILVDMDDHLRPLDQIEALHDFFLLNKTYRVSSLLFNAVGITELYFTDLDLPAPPEGYLDTQPFTLTAKSHVPIELLITED